ncbi:MAG: ribose-phosphate pyrophosphokinase [Candidatus Dadabacteria bacterium]|nr:ribose-phosphate pyrophosphokinase [Candidatus Dadabacteria bacterium]MCY4042457.1 ribose-phosphate pyrophosphokinase [Candidatus Dadabacteria bacterium]MCY4047924.1 ribose-phosphate pyrophosphokinase [Candidatus Dadabacteria bacterium]
MSGSNEEIKVFSGNSNTPLFESICEKIGVKPGEINIHRFSDGEIYAEIVESVRGADVFVVQSTCPPVNENLMELLIITDALKRASAASITAVMPYYGYSRQDRKVKPRGPISAKLIADTVVNAGVRRVMTIDLHAGQIQGFFDVPVDHLYASPVIINYLNGRFEGKNAVVVSPDAGGMERARFYADRMRLDIAMTTKRRTAPNVADVDYIIGEVKDRHVIIVDDMVDTAGTATQAAEILMNEGALSVSLCCTHGILSGPAIDRINSSALDEVIVTNTIPQEEKMKKCDKLTVLCMADLIGESIRRVAKGESISPLFN